LARELDCVKAKPNLMRLQIAGIAAAILMLAIGGYVGGYYMVSDRTNASLPLPDGTFRPVVVRYFRSTWLAWLYLPAVKMEARLTGRDVVAVHAVEGGGNKVLE
jgi:hypothetical protein